MYDCLYSTVQYEYDRWSETDGLYEPSYQYLLLHLREPARADRLKFFAIATPSTNPHMALM